MMSCGVHVPFLIMHIQQVHKQIYFAPIITLKNTRVQPLQELGEFPARRGYEEGI